MQGCDRFIRKVLHLQARLAFLIIRDQLRLYFVERLQMGLFMRFHLNNVIAVGSFHQSAGLANSQRKRSFFEFRNHLAPDDPAKLSTLRARTGVL